jgi:hypothetical protein
MITLEQLPPDQRAVLSLLLRQRKRYDEVAEMLSISARAVHDRAHGALAVLAPAQARNLDAAARERIGEYLLGQQDEREAAATKAELARSAPQREWARSLAVELVKLTAALPEIPVVAEPAPTQPAASTPAAPISRRGGALLLGGIVAVAAAIVAVVLSTGGSGGGAKQADSHALGGSGHGGSTSATTSSTSPTIEKVATLKPPSGHGSARGGVIVGTVNGSPELELLAVSMPPTHGFYYVVWLLGSHGEAVPLGRTPNVGSDGRIDAYEPLPANAGSATGVELTRETTTHPTSPSLQVVLRGKFVSR